MIWAVLGKGTAHLRLRDSGASRLAVATSGRSRIKDVPRPIRFREDEDLGLLVRMWVNGAGPYTFAIDTGAGATILSSRVASETRVSIDRRQSFKISGLSGIGNPTFYQKAFVSSLAIGDESNYVSTRGAIILTDHLPAGIDGILDPTEIYWPLGYTIDIANGEMSAFDPYANPLRSSDDEALDGTVVQWLLAANDRRPFVRLADGRRALLDTGSRFGLLVPVSGEVSDARNEERNEPDAARDLAGGGLHVRKVAPTTVRIGALVLRRVPTNLLNTDADAPVLLGRQALRPFHLTFDPVNRLIRLAPE
jgi:hypothetical protein